MMPMKLDPPETPKYYGPFEARAKLMNLQNLAQQQQLGQQQLQVGQMSIEDHQRALAQRKAIDQAYRDSFTIGEDGTPQLDEAKFSQALATAGHGSAIPGILEGQTKYKKSLADLGKVRGDVAVLERDAVGNLAASVQAGNNDPHLFLTGMTQGVHSGAVTADHVKPLMDQVTAALDADPTGEQARALVGQITNQMIAGSPKQRELGTARMTAEAQAKLHNVETEQKLAMGPSQLTQAKETARKTTLEADELQRKLDMIKNTKPSDVLALVDQVVPPDVKANHALNLRTKFMVTAKLNQGDFAGAQDVIKTAAAEMRQLEVATDPRVQAAKVNVTVAGAAGRENAIAQAAGIPTAPATGAAADLHGEDYLKTLRPAFAARLRQMGAGDITAPTGRAATTGAGGQIMNALMQYDPTFNERRAQLRKAFTTGPDGRNIGNLNTATVHLDQLYDAAMAMKNGSFQPGNEAWNRLSTIFGSSMPTNFDALKVTVSGEMANALKGVATDPEIAHINETLSRAKSPEQLAGVVDEDLQSIAGKMNTYHERAQQQDVGKWSPVLPSARAVFQRHGIDPDTLKKTGASGARGGGKIEKWGYDSRGQLVRQ